jgi:hypothetical protein
MLSLTICDEWFFLAGKKSRLRLRDTSADGETEETASNERKEVSAKK